MPRFLTKAAAFFVVSFHSFPTAVGLGPLQEFRKGVRMMIEVVSQVLDAPFDPTVCTVDGANIRFRAAVGRFKAGAACMAALGFAADGAAFRFTPLTDRCVAITRHPSVANRPQSLHVPWPSHLHLWPLPTCMQ